MIGDLERKLGEVFKGKVEKGRVCIGPEAPPGGLMRKLY